MDVFVNVKTRLEARCFCDLKSTADERTNLCVSEGGFFYCMIIVFTVFNKRF